MFIVENHGKSETKLDDDIGVYSGISETTLDDDWG